MDVAPVRTFASTKRSLLALSHAMERSLEVGRSSTARSGALLIGLFQRAEYFDVERDRYARIAADGAVCVVGFVGRVEHMPPGVTAVEFDKSDELASEWALVVIDGALGTALIAHDADDLMEGEISFEAARLFTANWSFNSNHAAREARRILDVLGDRLDASLGATAEANIRAAEATSPSLTERRLAAITELLVTSIDSAYHRSASLRAQLARERHLSETDPLTGLHNRRYLERYLSSPVDDLPMGMAALLVDLDGLKVINDTHGHAAGDAALTAVSDGLLAVTRPQDVVARIGGDEFLLVLPGLDADEGVRLGERIVERILEASLPQPWGEVPLTVSVGVAMLVRGGVPMDVLDEALYSSKRSGGSRVSLAAAITSRPSH